MKSRGITSLVLSILIATAIIIILVGTYAAFTFTGGAGNTLIEESPVLLT